MTQKPRVLFVDDEPNILDGLRLMLREKRGEWDMAFVQSGQDALAHMDAAPQDVLVTDMRMPGMDGGTLLSLVRERHPDTTRIVLSGYSDQESVLRTVKLAHQYLSKPTKPALLKQAIAKALALRNILGNPRLKRVILNIDALPALPPLYTRLTAELANENSSLGEIGDIISKDLGMSASILRLVNSAFFGLPSHVSSIHHAVNLLGTETIRVLVLSIHLFSTFNTANLPDFSLGMVWEHSARVSCFAKAIAELEGLDRNTRDDCFISGMLHDVGKLVMAACAPAEYRQALEHWAQTGGPLHLAEEAVLGASHAEIGAYLINTWGFPDSIVEAVCWHHRPDKIDCARCTPLMSVAVANHFDHVLGLPVQNPCGYAQDIPCISRAEYMERLAEWQAICAQTRAAQA